MFHGRTSRSSTWPTFPWSCLTRSSTCLANLSSRRIRWFCAPSCAVGAEVVRNRTTLERGKQHYRRSRYALWLYLQHAGAPCTTPKSLFFEQHTDTPTAPVRHTHQTRALLRHPCPTCNPDHPQHTKRQRLPSTNRGNIPTKNKNVDSKAFQIWKRIHRSTCPWAWHLTSLYWCDNQTSPPKVVCLQDRTICPLGDLICLESPLLRTRKCMGCHVVVFREAYNCWYSSNQCKRWLLRPSSIIVSCSSTRLGMSFHPQCISPAGSWVARTAHSLFNSSSFGPLLPLNLSNSYVLDIHKSRHQQNSLHNAFSLPVLSSGECIFFFDGTTSWAVEKEKWSARAHALASTAMVQAWHQEQMRRVEKTHESHANMRNQHSQLLRSMHVSSRRLEACLEWWQTSEQRFWCWSWTLDTWRHSFSNSEEGHWLLGGGGSQVRWTVLSKESSLACVAMENRRRWRLQWNWRRLEWTPRHDSPADPAERATRTLEEQVKVMLLYIKKSTGIEVLANSCVWSWLLRHAGWVLFRSCEHCQALARGVDYRVGWTRDVEWKQVEPRHIKTRTTARTLQSFSRLVNWTGPIPCPTASHQTSCHNRTICRRDCGGDKGFWCGWLDEDNTLCTNYPQTPSKRAHGSLFEEIRGKFWFAVVKRARRFVPMDEACGSSYITFTSDWSAPTICRHLWLIAVGPTPPLTCALAFWQEVRVNGAWVFCRDPSACCVPWEQRVFWSRRRRPAVSRGSARNFTCESVWRHLFDSEGLEIWDPDASCSCPKTTKMNSVPQI